MLVKSCRFNATSPEEDCEDENSIQKSLREIFVETVIQE